MQIKRPAQLFFLLFAICGCQTETPVRLDFAEFEGQVDFASFPHHYYDYLFNAGASKAVADSDVDRILNWETKFLEQSAGRVNRSLGQLFVQLDLNQEILVQQEALPLDTDYYFIGMVPQMRAAIFVARYTGGGEYFSMRLSDGQIQKLAGFPWISPDQTYAVMVDRQLGHYQLHLHQIEADQMFPVAQRSLDDFVPTKMKWLDARSFLLQGFEKYESGAVHSGFMHLKGQIYP